MGRLILYFRRAKKYDKNNTSHVQRAQHNPKQCQHDEHRIQVVEDVQQYLVFAEETCQWNDAGQRRGANHERPACYRQSASESTHFPHIGLIVHGVHNAACAQEQQGFGDSVGDEVEYRCAQTSGAQRQHHQPEMADRGIGENALDVVHHQRQRPSEYESE